MNYCVWIDKGDNHRCEHDVPLEGMLCFIHANRWHGKENNERPFGWEVENNVA